EGVNPDNPEESLGPYIAFIKWIVTADANYIKDVTSQKYTIALSEVLTEAVTPSAELIENSLSGGRVSEKNAREAFGAFACLLGAPADGRYEKAGCSADERRRAIVRGTVQRLEERQVLGPWLERLVRTSEIDLDSATNAAVLNEILSQGLPS